MTDAECGGMSEIIKHVTSACRVLASTDYTHRHNQMKKVIHQELALHHELIKTRVPLPLVMSETGVVPRTLPKNLKELGISGGGVITTVQKAVLLGTCATVQRFLNIPSII